MQFYGPMALASLSIITFLFFLFKSWLKTYVESHAKNLFDTQIEKFRSDLRIKETQITSLREIVLSNRYGRIAADEKTKREALQAVWDGILIYGKFKMSVSGLSMLRLENMTERALAEENMSKFFSVLSGFQGKDFKEFIPSDGVDKYRPYLSDGIWSIFEAYRAIALQSFLMLKAMEGGIEPSKIFGEEKLIETVVSAMPHMSDYLKKYGIGGAMNLFDPLKKLALEQIKVHLENRDSDYSEAAAAMNLLNLVGNDA